MVGIYIGNGWYVFFKRVPRESKPHLSCVMCHVSPASLSKQNNGDDNDEMPTTTTEDIIIMNMKAHGHITVTDHSAPPCRYCLEISKTN